MRGELVSLRAYEKSDADALFRWFSDEVDNSRAVRCYEKCGFVREGPPWQESFVDGKYRDVLMMGLLREDYEAASRP
ncbi:GNAT family N-acetyltransferase [Candidatus Binatus soli]|jgi:RimJ/RimL family protein N-acetyltransferase|uniref:GNAT family N-acetyltransferase n=1 Tax=Candidatus Binatus soli TaxID=1953413 RepID=UPI003D0AEBBD